MIGRVVRVLFAAALLSAASAARPAAQEYRVKPSDLAPMASDGTLRRIVQGFGTWTLICDEYLSRRERVCNVSQELVDDEGRTAFSWSLAATRAGQPVMILRRPRGGGGSASVDLALPREMSRSVDLSTCDAATCIGFLPVTKAVGQALRRGGTAQVTFMRDGRLATLDLPLGRLTSALSAMRVR